MSGRLWPGMPTMHRVLALWWPNMHSTAQHLPRGTCSTSNIDSAPHEKHTRLMGSDVSSHHAMWHLFMKPNRGQYTLAWLPIVTANCAAGAAVPVQGALCGAGDRHVQGVQRHADQHECAYI